jgi:uracil-DNA glycosylase
MNFMNFIDEQYSWRSLSLWEYLSTNVPSGWEDFFLRSDVQQCLHEISIELDKESKERNNCLIYPQIHHVFKAFYTTPLADVKAVIIGMDPYHNGTNESDGSATGLCFSVKHGNAINPSLRNIYKELKNCGHTPEMNGNLTHWAKQGVLLLNMALTVEKGSPDSHTSFWYPFSEKVVQYIDEQRRGDVTWLLFGSQAHNVGNEVLNGIIVKTTHPSPFSATRNSSSAPAFIGSKVFNRVTNIKW